MKRLCLSLFLLAAVPAFGCIQSYETTLQGKKIEVSGLSVTSLDLEKAFADRDATFWRSEQAKLLAKPQTQQTRNDYAVTLIHLGDVAAAMKELRAIEEAHPGIYATAANLGTAYELSGDNVQALQWIRESIRRNSKAHDGTEWVHVAILEAKLAQAKDSSWLDEHSILGMDFGPDAKPKAPARYPLNNIGKPVTAKEFESAIFHQLMERMQFVKPRDLYVADLLFDWGNSVALTATIEGARNLYRQSLRYGPRRELLVRRRMAHMQAVLQRASS